MSTPEAYRVGRFDLIPADIHDPDPRGLVFMWEPPQPSATYVIGCDPTEGITNWHRELRRDDDVKIDNAAIEVIRVGVNAPDVQVAEFAAPIDPFELAEPLNLLGRLYGGANEDHEAHVIIEIHPGPGMATQRELINRFGYSNFFVWRYLDSMVPTETRVPRLGWVASNASVRDLWVRGLRHLKKRLIHVRSPWLIEEMADVETNGKGGYEAYGSRHDDRIRALLLALWSAHDWSSSIEPYEPKTVETSKAPSWQASDMSYEDMKEAWEDRVEDLQE